MANPVKSLGKGVVYIGLGVLFVVAIIGTISLDLLMLTFVLSQRDNRNQNFFATLYAWQILSTNRSSLFDNIGFSLLASPFISAISIGISFAIGLPEFGILLLAGWVCAFTIILVGAVIHSLGDTIERAFSDTSSSRGSSVETTFTSSTSRMSNTFGNAPQHQHNDGRAAANQTHYDFPLSTSRGAPAPSAPTMDEDFGELPSYAPPSFLPPSYEQSQKHAAEAARLAAKI